MENELSERLLNFAVRIISMAGKLNKTYEGRHILGQLFRSGTSAGANYEEASAGESRADFIHKMQIALKELRESYYWLRLTDKSCLLGKDNETLNTLLQENKELMNIFGKSVVTAKRIKKTVK